MRCIDSVFSRLFVVPMAVAMFACGGPSQEPPAADTTSVALASKAYDTGETPPVESAPSTHEKEALDLRIRSNPGDVQAMTAAFSYSASNTNSALMNTVNVGFNLSAGQTITLGTCGVNGASGSGDTYLRFYDPSGVQVAISDDACGGALSNFSYTVSVGGTYVLRAGCFGSTSCSGTVAYSVGGALFSYSTSNTNSATINTVDAYINLSAGQIISLGTCGLTGASGSGDTYLRFFNPSGVQVAYSDDACGALSNFTYTVPVSGTYLLRSGCFSSTACSGTVAYLAQ